MPTSGSIGQKLIAIWVPNLQQLGRNHPTHGQWLIMVNITGRQTWILIIISFNRNNICIFNRKHGACGRSERVVYIYIECIYIYYIETAYIIYIYYIDIACTYIQCIYIYI